LGPALGNRNWAAAFEAGRSIDRSHSSQTQTTPNGSPDAPDRPLAILSSLLPLPEQAEP
jgi:hypothetical protein